MDGKRKASSPITQTMNNIRNKPNTPPKMFTIDDVMNKLTKLDTIETSIQDLRNTYEAINIRQTKLETQTEHNTSSIDGLQDNLDHLQSEVNKLQYDKIQRNIIIYGIPFQQEENIEQLTIKIINLLLNNPVDANCIITRRMPIRSISPPIVVSFRDYNTKLTLLSNWKTLQKSTVNNIQKKLKDELHISTTNTRISITEEQTPFIIGLFKEAKQSLGSRFKFIWIKYGSIYLREKEQTPVHKIVNRTQLYEFQHLQQNISEEEEKEEDITITKDT